MLKIDRDRQSFSQLESCSLTDAAITERYDLQAFIANSPEEFFREIGQDLFLLGTEVVASNNVQDRIDLLAVDREGTAVIVELKRSSHKLQLLQAISYAGMISHWSASDFLALIDSEQQEALADFLEVDQDDINRQQRIILVAEAYDYSLLVSAEWLCDMYGVDILCCRVNLARDEATGAEYVVCSNVYPAPELTSVALPRGRKRTATASEWSDWDSALEGVSNPALVAFFREQLAAGCEHYLPKRILRFRNGGKRRWSIAARRLNGYVWQDGRFAGDVEFWRSGVSRPEDVKPVENERCLRFFVETGDAWSFSGPR